ncbi:MAG TPA: tripartite tricarboxylate transporter substrate binding protein [Burkholderiaceae bacterium]|nr:tripartite tricarboxylate transporter substrate binding protein [Burkholderiaceae bacterium]
MRLIIALRKLAFVGWIALTGFPPHAAADDYPSRPIRVVVPYGPGSLSDTIVRSLGALMSTELGVPFVIENKPGANTFLGLGAASTAKPDGYTLALTTVTTDVINPLAYRKLPYDNDSLAPLAVIASSPIIFLVPKDMKAETMSDFVALAKSDAGGLNYGSTGQASSNRVVTEKLLSEAGIRMVNVPFADSSPIHTAMMRGDVHFYADVATSALPRVKAGQLKALAIASPERLSAFPGVRTTAESGYPGYQMSVWYGLRIPANTPADRVAKLTRAINNGLADAAFRQQFESRGMVVSTRTGPAEMAQIITDDRKRWGAMLAPLNIVLD